MSRLLAAASLALPLLAAFAVTSTGTGCSPNDPFQTKGQLGVAEFSLSSSQCLLGCGTDRPVLLGSSITVRATMTTRTEDAFVLRVKDAAMGTAAPSTQDCTCSDNHSSETIECTATCAPGMSKSLTVSLDVQTKAAGDVALELVDAKGITADGTSFTVRPAKTITANVSSQAKGSDHVAVDPGADGAFTVHVGNEVDVIFQTMDDQGNALVFTQHGVAPSYSNAKALTPSTDIADKFFGFTDQEVAVAKAPGDGQIALAAQGASTIVKFHVVK